MFHVWHTHRSVRSYSWSERRTYLRVIATLVPSIAIYSAAVVALLVCYFPNYIALLTLSDVMTPLIVRIYLDRLCFLSAGSNDEWGRCM